MRFALTTLALATAFVAGCSSNDSGGGGAAGTAGAPDGSGPPVSVSLPGVESGNGFDDLRYSKTLHKVIAPGNWTGNIYLVDPDTLDVTTIGGFTREGTWNGGDTQGPATLDEGEGFIFVADRTSQIPVASAGSPGEYLISVVDPSKNAISSSITVLYYPDYLRYVKKTREVWISEPYNGQVEVLSVSTDTPPVLTPLTTIGVGSIPEGLGVDNAQGLAFTQGLFDGKLYVMDAAQHTVTGSWSTGCTQTHGNAAVDEERGLVFVGCLSQATVSDLDIANGGTSIDTYTVGPGAFLPAYAPDLHHLYVRGDPGTPIATIAVAKDGKFTVLDTVDSVNKGHCMAADDRRHYWTCDWNNGALIRLGDPHPATP